MFYWVLFLIPKKFLSRLIGYLADYPFPPFIMRRILKWFVKRYQINLDESLRHLESFRTLNELFTRKLKPDMRPIGKTPYVHPADSQIVAAGLIERGIRLQIKRAPYTLEQLLPGLDTSQFLHGYYGLYYLCPTDYHRVHSPVQGKILSITHVPGLFWPVNQWSSQYIEGLFYKNERVIIEILTSQGLVTLTMVAATNVGQISLTFDPTFREQARFAKGLWKKSYPDLFIQKGEELGIFHLGSTVVILISSQYYTQNPIQLKVGEKVHYGQSVTG
jgi:phosphatidylserine decarboxylase